MQVGSLYEKWGGEDEERARRHAVLLEEATPCTRVLYIAHPPSLFMVILHSTMTQGCTMAGRHLSTGGRGAGAAQRASEGRGGSQGSICDDHLADDTVIFNPVMCAGGTARGRRGYREAPTAGGAGTRAIYSMPTFLIW